MHRTLTLLLLFINSAAAAVADVTPPGQPEEGPGGKRYAHAAVRVSIYGRGAAEVRVIEPAEPRPASAPVVIFTHGWGAVNPRIYGAWIEHIVRRGNIVIFPRYQNDLLTPQGEFTPNAIDSVKDALKRMQSGDHVRPQLDKAAYVGHSVGGILAVNLAALAADHGLPQPRAVFSVQPGISTAIGERWQGVALADLSKIPAETLLLVIVGDRDSIVGKADGERIYRQASAVKPANKNLLLMNTDTRGNPPLLADHQSPSALKILPGDETAEELTEQNRQRAGGGFALNFFRIAAQKSLNALDYHGYWKLFDALCDAAWHDRNRDAALGGTPRQLSLGAWSDGTPVTPMQLLNPR